MGQGPARDQHNVATGGELLLVEAEDLAEAPLRAIAPDSVAHPFRSNDAQPPGRRSGVSSREKGKKERAAIEPEAAGANRFVFRRAAQALAGGEAHEPTEAKGEKCAS